MLLGGAAMLVRAPVQGYAVTCTRAPQIHCTIERETSRGMQRSLVPLGADAAAVVRVEERRRGGSRVFLYLTSASREVFAAEFEGDDAIDDAQAAATTLNRVFAASGTATERIEARPPAYLRWLAWGALGVMALLVLAIYRELVRRKGTSTPRMAA
jgi:hypothetical protein